MNIDFDKSGGLVPAIIQDVNTSRVLMLGFMNAEALEKSRSEGRVTFYSRSKQRLWTKGETSGNFLSIKEIIPDCDNDTLLIKVETTGPVCHTGNDTCFHEDSAKGFLYWLEAIIADRKVNPKQGSYTSELFRKGINKIAQKVGEEATELVIEAKDDHPVRLLNEAADLLYHTLVLLCEKDVTLAQVEEVLRQRHK